MHIDRNPHTFHKVHMHTRMPFEVHVAFNTCAVMMANTGRTTVVLLVLRPVIAWQAVGADNTRHAVMMLPCTNQHTTYQSNQEQNHRHLLIAGPVKPAQSTVLHVGYMPQCWHVINL